MSTIKVYGSWGSLEVDASTGCILSKLPKNYDNIHSIDLEEWRRWLKQTNRQETELVDILSVGYWYKADGTLKYEPPDQDFRDMVYEDGGSLVVGPDTAAMIEDVISRKGKN